MDVEALLARIRELAHRAKQERVGTKIVIQIDERGRIVSLKTGATQSFVAEKPSRHVEFRRRTDDGN